MCFTPSLHSEWTTHRSISTLVCSHYNQGNCPCSHCITINTITCSVHFFIHYNEALWFLYCHTLALPESKTPDECQNWAQPVHNPFTTSLHPLFLLRCLNGPSVNCCTLSKNAFEFFSAQGLILFLFFLLLWPLSRCLSIVSVTL